MSIAKILTDSTLTVVVSGRKAPFTIGKDHPLFADVLKAVDAKDEKKLLGLIDVASTVKKFSSGKVEIVSGEVVYNGEVVSSLIATRILELFELGADFTAMAKFLENLMLNPSFRSRQELYGFLENGNCPITEDGRFLAYKWVRADYKDVHSGTFDNSVGKVISMDRGRVDDNRDRTCSAGLHVCTHGYTKFGERLMLVAINPADVVSVPSDYNDAKMRVCKYEVLSEVSSDDYTPMSGGVVNTQKREANGRFARA
jgi:hypothetical protein